MTHLTEPGATTGLEIAVVGMALRFPGAKTLEQFWNNLRDGVESISYFTDEELEAAGDSPNLVANPAYVKVGRIIEGENLFDAALFGMSPREAELVDPQQRLFLECAYEALEHAGYDSERYPGLVGVYAGIKMTTYLWNIYTNPEILAAVGDINVQIANDKDYVATRLSYKLSLRGPSFTVQSACSTSLVAVHLGCQGLLAGECDMALAGGVAVRTQQVGGHTYREGEILSPDGHVRAFDAGARGTIFGNGLGVVVLKRLEDAIADGDHVAAVIKGSAVNNDSSARVGFTAPGADGQERVIRAAHVAAEVDPETISYVEAHGTGTAVGDPIEFTSLTRAFRARTQKKQFCGLGSVKTNIGHLAAASGVAGLLKTILALENRQLPPSLLFERPNPQIDFASSPFYMCTELKPWEANGTPRRAGVSAFGIGGTNAHAIVEEAPPAAPSGPSRPWQLLVLSAKTETALAVMTGNLAAHLKKHPEQPLADVANTLQVGRRLLDKRRVLVCRDSADAAGALQPLDAQRVLSRAPEAKAPPVAFLFSGQGSQHVRMTADLYREEEVFRAEVDRCCDLLLPHLRLDLRGVLYPPAPATPPEPLAESAAEAESELQATRLAQPALFVVEYALARLWMSWGVQPAAMLGHSIGEYVAACLAGVFPLADALRLVAVRGRLIQNLPAGSMLTVSLPEAEVLPLLGAQLSLAAVNAPERSVVSGPSEAVAALADQLTARGVGCRPLHTSHAFHSAMMEPALAPFLAEVSRIDLKAPQLPYLSNVTGAWITAAEATDPGYWARHLRGTVRFADGLAELYREPQRALLEVGPGQSLATLARQHPARQKGHAVVASGRHPKDLQDDQAVLLGALGQLWLAGVEVDWAGFHAGERRRRVVLPTYPFEGRHYFIKLQAEAMFGTKRARKRELLDWFYLPFWKPSAPPVPYVPAAHAADAADAADAAEPARWLVFADDQGLGVELVERLKGMGESVATVVVGQKFADHGGAVYEVCAARREDYDALLAALVAQGGLPDRIVHLWTVGADEAAAAPSAPEVGFYSLLCLQQALGGQKVSGRIELAVVSSGVQSVDGSEALCPEKALVLGPCKVGPQEYPFLACRSVDVVLPAASTAAAARARLVDLLAGEVAEARPEAVVAYRNGRRFVQAFEPVQLDRAVDAAMPLRERGVYLVTGGLGGIGLVLAEHLAAAYKARLALTGASGLPPREEWDEWLQSQPADDTKSRRIRKVREIEALGGEVLALKADVADETEMRAAVAAIHARFGPIQGVIHSAGVAGGGIIQTKTREVASRVIAPKLRGSRVLEAVLAGEPLDFFVLCSSTIAVLGNFGQVDYCAANSFLDAFAREHAARNGVATVSINWGGWKEVGMAVNTRLPTSVIELHAAAGRAGDPAAEFHPLVHELTIDTGARKVFSTLLRVEEQWALSEHRILGTGTIPGTGQLEMIRAAVERLTGRRAVAFSDVLFRTPLMVPDGETKEVRITFEPQGDGWSFHLHSRAAGRGEAPFQEHSFGSVAPSAAAPRRVDLPALLARCSSGAPIELGATEKLVSWGPRWRSLQEIHSRGGSEALALLELPEEYVADLERYHLHPALLDVATALATATEDSTYLPLSYGSLRMTAPLPRRFYSHLQQADEGGAGREAITADVTLFDEAGDVLVEVRGFTLKRLSTVPRGIAAPGEAAAREAAPSAAAAGEAAADRKGPSPFVDAGMLSSEGLEAFRRVLSRRPGPQVVVSPRDLLPTLEQIAKAASGGALGEVAKLATARPSHPRPDVQTSFVEPESDLERTIARIWQEVLAIDSIGRHDNFYELGGDSVLGIQILARARAAGVELTSNQLFQHQTIADLAKALGDQPGEGRVRPEAAATAERFSLLSEAERDKVLRLLGDAPVEDVYPLSPLQQGFLFHTLSTPESGMYLEQLSSTVVGEVQPRLLERAWQSAVDRHSVLRTSFLWEDLDRPLQKVVPKVEFHLRLEDWRDLSASAQKERFAEAKRADKRQPFDLSREPLMRVQLFQTAEREHLLLWTHHHMLMDGWSAPLLVSEVFAAYDLLLHGAVPKLDPPRPFRDYVAWLLAQDLESSADFWRRALAGFSRPTPLAADRPAPAAPPGPEDHERRDAALSPEATAALQSFARHQQLTLSNVAQAMWALLLGRASGERDVLYGTSISSRPAELSGIESLVGLFLNALPVRVRLPFEEPVASWLKGLQDLQRELLANSHTPLVEIQGWSAVPRDQPLFETVYEFWNFPAATEERANFQIRDGRYDVATNYPLSLRVLPEAELKLQLTYDRRRFDAATIDRMLRELQLAFSAVVARPEATLAELSAALDEALRQEREERAKEMSGMARDKLKSRVRRPASEPGA